MFIDQMKVLVIDNGEHTCAGVAEDEQRQVPDGRR